MSCCTLEIVSDDAVIDSQVPASAARAQTQPVKSTEPAPAATASASKTKTKTTTVASTVTVAAPAAKRKPDVAVPAVKPAAEVKRAEAAEPAPKSTVVTTTVVTEAGSDDAAAGGLRARRTIERIRSRERNRGRRGVSR